MLMVLSDDGVVDVCLRVNYDLISALLLELISGLL